MMVTAIILMDIHMTTLIIHKVQIFFLAVIPPFALGNGIAPVRGRNYLGRLVNSSLSLDCHLIFVNTILL